MVALTKPPLIEHDEYLTCERQCATRNEYHAGVVVAMTGATWTHGVIVGQIAVELGLQLKGRPCKTIPNDLRVRVNSRNMDFYPDIVVVCGNPVFYDAAEDTILNPSVVIEVLSPSTAAYDRGEKRECYQTLPSLHTYALVSQFEPKVEIFTRIDASDHWDHEIITGMDGIAHLAGLDCRLQLADIYADVEFDAQQDNKIEPS
jgi:Uma2 family endonuclease